MNLDRSYIRDIIAMCQNRKLSRQQCAYVLATAWHETGGMRWLKEIWGPTDAQRRYEGRYDLGNTQKGDGWRFMGRGFVHITGRRNYTDWSKRLGVDLVADPEKAMQPTIAATILVDGMRLGTFTGKKLSDYINSGKTDFVRARRVVNVNNRAELIASYAVEFDSALAADGYSIAPAAAPIPEKQPWWVALVQLIAKLWSK